MDDEPCPYRIVAPMDEDARGVTYLAEARTGVRGHVVLKLLGPRDDADAIVSRYRQWKPAIERVRHPSVAPLLDVGLTADGATYVATAYVGGWPLSALASKPPLGPGAHQAIARQLSAAMEAAHEAGVVHLTLDSTKVKISTTNGPHATILGLGSALILDGADWDSDADRLALTRLRLALGLGQ